MQQLQKIRPAIMGLLVAALALGLAGCSEKSTPPGTRPPALPPQSSFIMDYSSFNSAGKSAGFVNDDSDPQSKINWGQSALRIGFWNLALTVTLAVPVAAFAESFQHQPVELEDGSWQWSYNVTVGVQYTCRLVGSVDSNTVQWKMYISKAGDFSDYLWYYGDHNLLATEGSWTVNRGPNETNPFLLIEWHRNATAGTADLKYTNIIPGDSENGGYIYYGVTADTDYDRFYHIHSISPNNLTEIEWNHSTQIGRVADPNFYGNEAWHCWDENLDDVDCP